MRLRWMLGLVLGLAGCHGETVNHTSQYLMLHPTELKNEMVRCQEIIQSGGHADDYCQLVSKTMENFFAILVEQQRQPEKFGQRILAAQEAYGLALTQAELAKQTLEQEAAAQASDDTLKASQAAYQQALANAADAKATVDALLVIVGESSPE